MGNGGNFEIPQDVLAVLPSDPYEQLDLARRITAMAVAERLSKLEGETGKLRAKLAEKDLIITDLNDRVIDAETTLQETTARLSSALDEQAKLTNERNLLVNTVKKLNRDVAKLETFKRTLMQSLQEDDDGGHKSSEYGGHASVAALVASEAKKTPNSDSWMNNRGHMWNEDNDSENLSQGGAPAPADLGVPAAGNQDVKHLEMDAPTKQSNNSHTPPLPPQTYAPVPTPPQPISQPPPNESSRWQSAGSPERPPPQESSKVPLPLSLPSSRSTTAPNSPPNVNSTPGRTPRVDGKEFFRQARNRLSYEQFSAFLANIKELNAHRQTREETLRKADKTFGPDNKDLYIAFDGLLSRHLSS
ncbi:hypothetical protein MPTK1_1g14350 [Marchantia polymorpha subsp. ruderalis]|uniref:At4g15545-like C-terminal domain-containing protein n=2 Tax=Marchantia polymorpha TaxID=3197 RepID=A0AAF6AQ28_MARPO|nr:hypothetical protein MARPO_0179s0016 [Marchantia polymorpha]PTQ27929.1 hypothetical protein MARPO_0179s0016 [Marchantia polymorpha]BBM98547.1 hypothetical protein Mp_1g14350 [Marchantia polymorpha subsp. ruderalis]BBM98548.1 hypothetical protein Mp_1g14350 [Marchantia polymorpha subsp. ruderalis]|eukprot:PTQ27928.1 hypothetical protein MARPO_0179s0016 [Marchantia polymorpha]